MIVHLTKQLRSVHTLYFIAAWGSSLLFLLFQGGKLAMMLFIICNILVFYLLLERFGGITRASCTRTLQNVDVQASRGKTIQAEQEIHVHVAVRVPGFWRLPYILIRDHLVRQDGKTFTYESSVIPDWKRQGQTTYRIQHLPRGHYSFQNLECMSVDIFGLFEHKRTVWLPEPITVMPRTVPIHQWTPFEHTYRSLHQHAHASRSWRETTQLNGVREYIYGDRLSRIHWNATAATGKLQSKEFEREALPKTIIVLDRHSSSYHTDDDFELAVSVTTSLFEYAKQSNMSLGLLSVGKEAMFCEPHSSNGQYELIINHFIEAQADGEYDLFTIMQHYVQFYVPGSFIVCITGQNAANMMPVMNWMAEHQLNPYHFWIRPQLDAQQIGKGVDEMAGKDYPCSSIDRLEELPHILRRGSDAGSNLGADSTASHA